MSISNFSRPTSSLLSSSSKSKFSPNSIHANHVTRDFLVVFYDPVIKKMSVTSIYCNFRTLLWSPLYYPYSFPVFFSFFFLFAVRLPYKNNNPISQKTIIRSIDYSIINDVSSFFILSLKKEHFQFKGIDQKFGKEQHSSVTLTIVTINFPE